MKRLLILAILCLFPGLLSAGDYNFGQVIPINWTVIDTSFGEPVAPDSIHIEIYFNMGTTPVVPKTAMTQWNSATGQYKYDFTIPDSLGPGVFNPRISWGALGQEWDLFIGNISVGKENILGGVMDSVRLYNVFGADSDYTYFVIPSDDTVSVAVFYHIGGSAGDAPDSQKTFDFNDW